MPSLPEDLWSDLRARAAAAAERADVPYSGRPAGAVLLLADGTTVPGTRVESASFSLVIPALVNAVTTAVALGRRDVVAAVLSRAVLPEEAVLMRASPFGAFHADAERADVLVHGDAGALPAPGPDLPPYLDAAIDSAEAGVALARAVAERAYIPESNFPVGCVLETQDGRLIPGVNVEHGDWSRILCAERNALGTAAAYGAPPPRALYLSCPRDAQGTPCGACRQLLAERADDAVLWMDRGDAPPERTSAAVLLPGSFTGRALAPRG